MSIANLIQSLAGLPPRTHKAPRPRPWVPMIVVQTQPGGRPVHVTVCWHRAARAHAPSWPHAAPDRGRHARALVQRARTIWQRAQAKARRAALCARRRDRRARRRTRARASSMPAAASSTQSAAAR